MNPHLCEYCGLDFTRRDNLRRHIISTHAEREPFRLLYWCGRCFQTSTRRDIIRRHISVTHAYSPGVAHYHEVHELNTGDIPTFITSHLEGVTDPLVVMAPFNPYNTASQAWLARHDTAYQPIYPHFQENLGPLDLEPTPSYSFITLDPPSRPSFGPHTPPPSSSVNELENNSTIGAEVNRAVEALLAVSAEFTLDPQSGQLDIAADQFDITNVPSTSNNTSLGYVNSSPSDTSSILEDHSETIRAISPSSHISISSTIVGPSFSSIMIQPDTSEVQELLRLANLNYPQVVLDNPQHFANVGYGINLNTNPHSNTDTQEAETEVVSPTDQSREPPAGEYHTGLWDLYGPLRDLTNIPDSY